MINISTLDLTSRMHPQLTPLCSHWPKPTYPGTRIQESRLTFMARNQSAQRNRGRQFLRLLSQEHHNTAFPRNKAWNIPKNRLVSYQCYRPGVLASLTKKKKDHRPDKKFRQGPLLQQGEQEQITGSPACLILEGVVGLVFKWSEGRAYPRVESEGLPRWFAHRLGGAVCRGLCNTRLLLPSLCFCSRLFKNSSWVFWFLCIHCPECAPTVHACSYFQSQIIHILLLQERCDQVQALQQRAPGPSLSHQ